MTEKIQSITGMNDILPEEAALWHRLESVAREVFENAGYGEIRTPLLETTPLFSRGIGEGTQVVQKEMYTFKDRGDDSVTLRPEGTAGVVRAYVQHSLHAQEEICKLYYMGPMFRYERPQKGRLRQFHQIGCEIFGPDAPFADAEVVTLADRIAKGVGLKDYDLFINTLGTNEERKPYLEKLVGYFSSHQKDLCEECQKRLSHNPLRLFDCKNAKCGQINSQAPLLLDSLGEESRKNFDGFQNILSRCGVDFKINPRIVRGLDYYEKSTFEFVSNKLGSQSAFCGGGRYNKLVEELGGPQIPGVGFGMGCERIIMLMQDPDATAVMDKNRGVFFAVFDEVGLAKAREIVQNVRDGGVRADSGFEVKSLKSQMRRANKLGYRYVAILGEEEMAQNKVMLKDLDAGEQKPVAFNDIVKATTL